MMMISLQQRILIERLNVLAIEYHAKQIDAFRFSERVYEMLFDHDKAMRLLEPKPQHGSST